MYPSLGSRKGFVDLPAGAGDGAPYPPSVLLSDRPKIENLFNGSIAHAQTRCGKDIQVSLSLADPPRLSYVCVHCHGADFADEPYILAMESNLILIRLLMPGAEAHDHFMYKVGDDGVSSLQLLPHPPLDLPVYGVGLLPTHGGSGYIIAALEHAGSMYTFTLCLLDSTSGIWTCKPAQADQQLSQARKVLNSSKVISIGGQSGTIGWVCFRSSSIFLCDVLLGDSVPVVVRHIPLPLLPPPPPLPMLPPLPPSQAQDVAVVQGCIKCVDLQLHTKPCPGRCRCHVPDGWTVTTRTWKKKKASANSLGSWDWHTDTDDCTLNSHVVATDSSSTCRFKLHDDADTSLTSLEGYYVGHPTLSLHGDDRLYLIAAAEPCVDEVLVLSLDMRNKKLQGVAGFATLSATARLTPTFSHSDISEFLNMHPGTKGDLKRPGMMLMRSCGNKLPRIPGKDYMPAGTNGEHKHRKDAVAQGATATGKAEPGDDAMEFE